MTARKELLKTELLASRVEVLTAYSSVQGVAVDAGWSPEEIMHHLFKTEYGIAKMFRASERICSHHPEKSTTELDEEYQIITTKLANRNEAAIAPEAVAPTDFSDSLDVVAQLERSRLLFMEMIDQKFEHDLSANSFPHGFFGEISLFGWMIFIARHELRHVDQLRSIGAGRLRA